MILRSASIHPPTTILGIDPGLQKMGWGVIHKDSQTLRFVACGTIAPNVQLALADRLFLLNSELQRVMKLYQPNEAAIEETFVNVNGQSTLKLGQARGAILLSLSLGGLSVSEYAATKVKKSLTGVGRAAKDQVGMMVAALLPHARTDIEAASDDARDALAVAICHAHYAALRMIS